MTFAILAAAWSWGQMADRPIVLRSKTDAQKLVYRHKITSQRLQAQGPTGSGILVWRMRTATGRLVHQFKTSRQRLLSQSKLSLDTRLMSVSEETTYFLVQRRKFEEPLFGQFRTGVQRVVDQFPTYTDFSR